MTDCAKRGNGGRLDEKTAVTSRRIKSNSRTSVFIDYLCRTRRKTSTRSMRMTVCHRSTPYTMYDEITSRSGTTGVITRDRYTHYTRCHPTSTCDIDISVARRRNITRGRIRKNHNGAFGTSIIVRIRGILIVIRCRMSLYRTQREFRLSQHEIA